MKNRNKTIFNHRTNTTEDSERNSTCKDKNKQRWEVLNLKGRADKYSESSIEVAAHTPILKKK
jgi:hypothetical protein